MTSQEDRIYDDPGPTVTAFLAAELGVIAVDLAGTRIGRFRVDYPEPARDVAADETLVVATDDDVLIRESGGERDPDGPATGTSHDRTAEQPYRPTDFGRAVAVGIDDDELVAASPDRAIYRRIEDRWLQLGQIDHDIRAVDGPLVAAGDGIYRAHPDGLDYVGLTDGRDVAAGGPFAATGNGLYELGNGWMLAHEEAFDLVACAQNRKRAHAASGPDLYARREGKWRRTVSPDDGDIAGIDYAYGETECTYVVTDEGTILVREPDAPVDADAWRTRNVGVTGVSGLAIPQGSHGSGTIR